MDWEKIYKERLVSSPQEAAKVIKSGDHVAVGYAAAEPTAVLRAICDRYEELENVEIFQGLNLGTAPFCDPIYAGHIRLNTPFASTPTRKAIWEGRADYNAHHFSDVIKGFMEGYLPVDVYITTVTPPDEDGYVCLGLGVDYGMYASEVSKFNIMVVNPNMPWTYGENKIHVSKIDMFVECDDPIPEMAPIDGTDETSEKIGKYVADLIEDGSTLQMGQGKISNAVLKYIGDKKDLGIHTEVFSNFLRPLIEKGIVTGAAKNIDKGKIVAAMVQGTRDFYDFVDRNEMIKLMPVGYVNDPAIISKNDKVCALNASLEVNLLGEACSEAIGNKMFSGIGGQVDFLRGAAKSKGGKPILILPATAKKGTVSRIVCEFKPGTPISCTRMDVQWVVTEYGAVNLFMKTVEERARLLISIAAPQFREQLEKDWFEYNRRMRE